MLHASHFMSCMLVVLLVGLGPLSSAARAQEEPADDVQEAVVEVAFADRFLPQGNLDPQLLLLKQYVRVESAFARRVCALSAEQETQLKLLNDEWLNMEVAKVQAPLQGLAAGIARLLGAAPPRGANDKARPEMIVRGVTKQIDTYVEQLLDEQQRLVYREEKVAKQKFRRESQAMVIIAAIDNRIYLSPQQREDLLPGVAQWLADKSLYWQFYFQNDEYLPAIPRSVLTQVLSPQQLVTVYGLHTHDYDSTQFELQMVQQQPPAVIDQ